MLHNIYFVARQAGTAAAFAPIIKKNRGVFLSHCYAYEDAYIWLKREGLDASKIHQFEDVKFIKRPELIITGTSLKVQEDNKFWSFALENSIPSIAFIDSWVNYWERFTTSDSSYKWNHTPETIAVIDEYMYEQCMKHNGPAEKLSIIGNPAFDALFRDYKELKTEPNRSKAKVLMVMDPLVDLYGEHTVSKIGFTEYDFLMDSLSVFLDIDYRGEIEIRLHPRERYEKYNDLIQQFSELDISITGIQKSKIQSLKEAQLVLGMNSILLYEAGILGKNVWSYQINAKKVSDIISNRSFINIISDKKDINKAMKSKSKSKKHNLKENKSSFTHLIKAKING